MMMPYEVNYYSFILLSTIFFVEFSSENNFKRNQMLRIIEGTTIVLRNKKGGIICEDGPVFFMAGAQFRTEGSLSFMFVWPITRKRP